MHQIEYEKVFEIYRSNWLIPSLKAKKDLQIKKFLDYMTENCSMNDIRSLSYESTLEGHFEALHYISDHLLRKYVITRYCK
jgi:hypothetical protein